MSISLGTAALVGAGISAAGGLLSGGMSSNASKHESQANRREARRQFNIQVDESVQRRVADALKAGINPLAALNASTNYSPTVHAGGYSGNDNNASGVSNAFNSVANGIQSYAKALALEDKAADDMEFDTQAKELDLENARLQNQYLRNQISAQTQNPGVDVEPAPSMQGEQLLFQPVYDIKGRPRLVVNQNALEADSDNPGYMSSILLAIKDAMASNQIDTSSGWVRSPQLRMMLDDFYYNTTGHHIKNLESLYISPTEAAMAASMLARGVS